MPPKVLFTKEQLIQVAFEIANEEGFDAITIRKVAQRLGCSISPIYVNFKEVEELKQEVSSKIVQLTENLIEEQNSGNPFLDIGIGAVLFAKKYPLLFDELLVQKNSDYAKEENIKDIQLNIMKEDPNLSQFSDIQLEILLLKMEAFQTGLSFLARVKKYEDILTDENIITLLKETGLDIIMGIKNQKSNLSSGDLNNK